MATRPLFLSLVLVLASCSPQESDNASGDSGEETGGDSSPLATDSGDSGPAPEGDALLQKILEPGLKLPAIAQQASRAFGRLGQDGFRLHASDFKAEFRDNTAHFESRNGADAIGL